jgi:hypothetical protein
VNLGILYSLVTLFHFFFLGRGGKLADFYELPD